MWARTNPTVSLVGGSLPYLNSPSVQHPGGLGAGDSWPEAQLESPFVGHTAGSLSEVL